MKIINVEQGSNEWLSWRKTVITATDCPAILGSSPWSTAYKCWQRKLGLIEEQKSNEAMERGKRLEPIARERFIKKHGINMKPIVVESTKYEFLGASLDGISDCGRYILEVKTGGSHLYSMAEQGVIPSYYIDQIQHQLLITGAEKCFYQASDETNDIIIEVFPDESFETNFMPKARDFWRRVAFFEPPTMQESDYIDMNDNLIWSDYAKMYREVSAEIKALEDKKEYIRRELINLCLDKNCSGKGVKVMKSIMKGRVSYEDIPEIHGVDIEKYRKSSTVTWKILVDKN